MRFLGWIVAGIGVLWALSGVANLVMGAGASGLGVLVSVVLFILPGAAVAALGALLLKRTH